tara:strand:- start:182 stop:454 length:273 start_codon:yes stop_codon:yes gene_type:complete
MNTEIQNTINQTSAINPAVGEMMQMFLQCQTESGKKTQRIKKLLEQLYTFRFSYEKDAKKDNLTDLEIGEYTGWIQALTYTIHHLENLNK